MRWEIVVTVKPHDLTAEGRAAAERVVERVARRLAAAGCDEIAWSSDELDAALARIDAQGRRAGKPEELGWMTSGLLAFVLSAAAEAPTHRPLRERVRAAVSRRSKAAGGSWSTCTRPATRGGHRCSDRP